MSGPSGKQTFFLNMVQRIVYDVVFDKSHGHWSVLKEGNKRATANFPLKPQAIEVARQLAHKHKLGQIRIHGKDGKFQREYTYGKDPVRYPS